MSRTSTHTIMRKYCIEIGDRRSWSLDDSASLISLAHAVLFIMKPDYKDNDEC